MSKRALIQLRKNGKVVGWLKVTPDASNGVLWAHLEAMGFHWIDSPDIEIEFDESLISSDLNE